MFKLSTWVATVLRVLLLVCLVHAYETVEDAGKDVAVDQPALISPSPYC